MSGNYTIGVVGNPNCGKTTLFNALTGSKQHVGNWPGVTVERKVGHYCFEGNEYSLVDLPGTYSLDVTDQEVSLDEMIARNFVHAREADLVVNIIDASNLERNLYLTSQLIEMRRPLVLALNMMDVAEERGKRIDLDVLAGRLDCPVVPITASTGEGVEDLKRLLAKAVEEEPVSEAVIEYDKPLEDAIAVLIPKIRLAAEAQGDSPRWLASRLLEGDDLALDLAGDGVGDDVARELLGDLADDVDILLADARYGFAHGATEAAVKQIGEVPRNISDSIDRVILNRVLGIPIFLLVMHLMFMFTINIGGSFIDFFDIFAGTLFVDGFGAVLGELGSPDWLRVLLANGIGGGVQVVATFIPIIGFLFLFLSVLEDSGYMARAAFVMDRLMRAIGLPGKSFVPLITGFGCTVPAVMATRTLEQERDRFMTIAMAPFMSCGARLPVYALFAAAFFPTGGQNLVFGLYLIGIAAAVLTGLALKSTLLKGESAPFVMELPPYHLPTVTGVLLRTWDRTRGFILRAGRIIVPMVLVLNVLNGIGTDGSFGNENTEKSLLSEVGRTISPVFAPLGLTEDNWPASVGIFTGMLAKEAVVGTLDAMYTAMGEQVAAGAGEARQSQTNPKPLGWRAGMTEEDLGPIYDAADDFDLMSGIAAAFATVPRNLVDAMGIWSDPLGLDIGDIEDSAAAAADQKVATGTFGAMVERFDGTAGAFAYLLFILLYQPCSAAIAAVYRETTPAWTIFVGVWTTGIAYVAATVFYQAAIFTRDPVASGAWIIGMLALLAGALFWMRNWASQDLGARSTRAFVARDRGGEAGFPLD